jgi:ATP-binding cassette, subfamily B, bacterial
VTTLAACPWPAARLSEAIDLLARRAGLVHGWPADGRGHLAPDGDPAVRARALGLSAEPFEWALRAPAGTAELDAPALLFLPERAGGPGQFLAVLRCDGRSVELLAPDATRVRVPYARLTELGPPAATGGDRDAILDATGLAGAHRESARRALDAQAQGQAPRRLRGVRLAVPPGASLLRQGLAAGLGRTLAELLVLQAAASTLFLLALVLVGRAALQGRLDAGWLAAFALLLLGIVPLSAMAGWREGILVVAGGALLRRRLMEGALRLVPEEMRKAGAGQLLGRVVESANLETFALRGGFQSALSLLDLGLAVLVLAQVPARGVLLPALLACGAGLAFLGWRLHRRRRDWTGARIDMTERMVERFVGHRTRRVQEPAATWHEDEDRELERYYEESRSLDRERPRLEALAGRGFLLAALAALSPLLIAAPPPAAGLALTLGGLLLAAQALERLAAGASDLLGAAIAWRQVAPLYEAARREEDPGVPVPGGPATEAVLEARDVAFRYPGRGRPAVREARLRLARGDRALLYGPSGGGKSTLAALLAGLRSPDVGLLRLSGLDRATWGAETWRRRVALAPQFHENHVLSGPLLWNLLLGRRWPPNARDVADAQQVCGELGLLPLLERMPAGILQPVGDMGWQLSHGERSRLFVARALLQEADVVILDEGFGALDPESLRLTLECARRRATTLVVLAHP